jgi:hypothetical protein
MSIPGECPRGDDPNTEGQYEEIQLFECIATEGNFRLSFRDELSKSISFNATAIEIESALESLSTIEAVSVGFSNPGSGACYNISSGIDNVWSITFMTEYGDLPPIIPVSASPGYELLGNNCFSVCYPEIPYVTLSDTELVMFSECADGVTCVKRSPTCAEGVSFDNTQACFEDVCGYCADSETICTACTQPNELDPHEECGVGDVAFHYCAQKTNVMLYDMITNKYDGPVWDCLQKTLPQDAGRSLETITLAKGGKPLTLEYCKVILKLSPKLQRMHTTTILLLMRHDFERLFNLI